MIKGFSKRGQEEMVGFALIVVIVIVILVVFLALFLRQDEREPVNSYKVEGFINSILQYNTGCEIGYEFADIKDLIYHCHNLRQCSDTRTSCEVLERDLEGLIESSWSVGKGRVKGYSFNISIYDSVEHSFKAGNQTSSVWGSFENLPRGVEISFVVYY